jgi:hypothetical protein
MAYDRSRDCTAGSLKTTHLLIVDAATKRPRMLPRQALSVDLLARFALQLGRQTFKVAISPPDIPCADGSRDENLVGGVRLGVWPSRCRWYSNRLDGHRAAAGKGRVG